MIWKIQKLGDIAEFSQGLQVPIENQLEKNHSNLVRFIRIVDYTNQNEPPRFITKPSDKYFVENEDIVMIRYGSQTAGKVVRGLSGVIANNAFKISILNKEIDKDYLYRFLSQQRIYDELNSGQGSSTMPAVSFGIVKNVSIEFPHFQTQKYITSILSSYDDLIENNLKRIKILEETAQNIYKEWFVNFRIPNYENIPLNQEMGLPEGWKRKNFEEIANFSQGLQVSTELQFEEKRDDRTRFIRIIDVTQGNQPYRYIETPDSKYIIEKGDIFMVRYGTPQVVIGYEGVIANNFFKISINDKTELLNNFLFMFLKQDNITQTLMALSSSATMPAISFKRIANIQILVPSIELQKKFSNQHSIFLDCKHSLEYQNRKLKEARDILLPRLMNRTIRV